MANWKVRSDDWTSAENQNGSSLTHYGVKGMRWGVRKEPDLKKDKRINQQKTMSKAAAKVAQSKRRVSSEYTQELAYSSYKPHSGTSLSSTSSSNSGGSSGYKPHSGVGLTGQSQSINPYENMSEEELMELVKQGKISKEYVESILHKKLDSSIENKNDSEPKGSKEYQEEMEFNSRKNNLSNTMVSDLKKDKSWKEKLSDGAKKVGETLKKIGNQVASVAKKAAEDGKNFLTKLFNVKPGNKTTTRGTDKPKTNTKTNSKTTSGIGAYVPKNARLQPTKRYKDITDWKRKNGR